MRSLTTERLDLVPLDPDRDAESLHVMLGDPEYDEYGDDKPTRDVAETRDRLAHAVDGNGGWTWAVRLRPSEQAIGAIGLYYDQGTTIRGLSWHLRRDFWGRGIMGEAAPVVVDHLLEQPHIDGVEAWIDTQNTRSLGVARRARLDERGRMPRVYADRLAQQVVMARAAVPRDQDVLDVRPTLRVRDIRATIGLLTSVLGLRIGFEHGDPTTYAQLAVAGWSGGTGLELTTGGEGALTPTALSVDIGIETDVVHERAVAAGVTVLAPPQDMPWYRREFRFVLPEGHVVRVIGPMRPTG